MLVRRSLLGAGLAAGLLPAMPTLARAQNFDRSRDVIQAIANAKAQAENLLAVSLYSNLSPENNAIIESANERIFDAITGVLGGIPAEEAIIYAEPAQVIVAEQMSERSVAVVPPARIPVIPASASSEGASEEAAAVVADIIKDAFGVKTLDVSGLMQVASELALLDILSRIAGMIRSGKWALAGEFIRSLLAQLAAAAQAAPAIEKAIGEQALKEILAGVSARFVPFLGWPVLVASILFSIVKHQNRLMAALDKSR